MEEKEKVENVYCRIKNQTLLSREVPAGINPWPWVPL